MWSRRRYLAALSSGATAALAGCSIGVFGSSDGGMPAPEGTVLGRELLTEDLVSITDSARASTPSIGSVLVRSPERVAAAPELPHELGQAYGLPYEFDRSAVELTLESVAPEIHVSIGDFSEDDVEATPPEQAESRGVYRDASLSVWEREYEGFGAIATGPGVFVRLDEFETGELAEKGLRTVLDAADRDGTSAFASAPHDVAVPHLDEGFWQSSWFPPIHLTALGPAQPPGGLSIRADDGTLYRRSVRIYPDESRAARSFLHREAVRRRIRHQDYAEQWGSAQPYDRFDVVQNGRTVVTNASIDVDDISPLMLGPVEQYLPRDLVEPLPA